MMTVVELLMTEYRYTLPEALYKVPLTLVFSLLGARAIRLGDTDRPGFADAAAGAARIRVKAYFAENYQVI